MAIVNLSTCLDGVSVEVLPPLTESLIIFSKILRSWMDQTIKLELEAKDENIESWKIVFMLEMIALKR